MQEQEGRQLYSKVCRGVDTEEEEERQGRGEVWTGNGNRESLGPESKWEQTFGIFGK